MSLNKQQLSKDAHKSKLGYSKKSPYKNEPYIDINTPNGLIDMSNTGIPLMANGRVLPPYSGMHQFDTNVVREIPLAQDGGEIMELSDEEIAEYRRQGYVIEEMDSYQMAGETTLPSGTVNPYQALDMDDYYARLIAREDSIFANQIDMARATDNNEIIKKNIESFDPYGNLEDVVGNIFSGGIENATPEYTDFGYKWLPDAGYFVGSAGDVDFRDMRGPAQTVEWEALRKKERAEGRLPVGSKNKSELKAAAEAAREKYIRKYGSYDDYYTENQVSPYPVQEILPPAKPKEEVKVKAKVPVEKALPAPVPQKDAGVPLYDLEGNLVRHVQKDSATDVRLRDKLQDGGQIMELDDAAIAQYRAGGYIVEEIEDYQDGGDVIEQHGWQYKREGDKYLTKRKTDTDWITATGDPLAHIKKKVYGEDVELPPSKPASAQTKAPIPLTQPTYAKGPNVRGIQEDLADNGYYLGPKGADGILGNFTQGAIEAQKAGVSAEEYNKRFESKPLKSLPGVSVPSTIVENTQGISKPVSNRLSADAEMSLDVAKKEEQEEQEEEGLPLKKEVSTEKGFQVPDAPYNQIPILDITDEVYQHADDFIIDINDRKSTLDLRKKMHKIDVNAEGSCLRGALNCSDQMMRGKAGANSIRQLMKDADLQRADLSKYSVPSTDPHKSSGFYHSKGYDAWEIGDALVGEGLAKDMWRIKPGSSKLAVPNDLYNNYIKKGKIPLGALVLRGSSSTRKHTDPKFGERSSHATAVVGFAPDGTPLVYDGGELKKITEGLAINRIVIPNGYENYTYGNLTEGRKQRLEGLGFDPKGAGDYKENEELPSYVNDIYKGAHEIKQTVGNDYDMHKTVMDKLAKRVVGLAGQESNFNNKGDLEVDWRRRGAIEGEGWLSNTIAKPLAKKLGVRSWFKDDTSYSGSLVSAAKEDWEVEMDAWEQTKDNPEQFEEKYAELRAKHPKGKKEESWKEMKASSVGPLAIKNLPEYAKNKLGLEKGDLYGMNVSDDIELERSSQAALVHLVEDYKKFEEKYSDMDLTEDELIDLATVAYNNKSKANNPKFVDFYIRNKIKPDNYLQKVKNYSDVYGLTEAELAKLQEEQGKEQGESNLLAGFFKSGGEVKAEDVFLSYLLKTNKH